MKQLQLAKRDREILNFVFPLSGGGGSIRDEMDFWTAPNLGSLRGVV